MVDRGVRDLREALLEVVEHRSGPRGDGRERHVVTHGEGRLLGVGRHGLEHHRHLFPGETERDLLPHEVLGAGRHLDGTADVRREQAVARPLGVRLEPRQPRLHVGVVLHRARRRRVAVAGSAVGVDADHVAGTESAAPHRAVTRDRHRTDLRRADDQAVLAHLPPQRTQPVAVERGADAPAVTEHETGRPVPRVGEARVVAEEAAHPAREVALALPRLGHEHGDGVANVAAAAYEQLDGGVELPGVGVLGIEHRTE